MHPAHSFATDDDAPAVTLHWLCRALGKTDYSDARRVRYAQGLVDDWGLPHPYPAMRGKRGNGGLSKPGEVVLGSTWPRAAVEAWLADFLPPDAAFAVDLAARKVAADDMDAMAGMLGGANLRLVGGREA